MREKPAHRALQDSLCRDGMGAKGDLAPYPCKAFQTPPLRSPKARSQCSKPTSRARFPACDSWIDTSSSSQNVGPVAVSTSREPMGKATWSSS